MRNSVSLENSLKQLRQAAVPVDFDRQYEIILERLDVRYSPVAALRTVLQPAIALTLAALVLALIAIAPMRQSIASEPVDEFMAAVFTMESTESDAGNNQFLNVFLDGTSEQGTMFN